MGKMLILFTAGHRMKGSGEPMLLVQSTIRLLDIKCLHWSMLTDVIFPHSPGFFILDYLLAILEQFKGK